MSLIRPKNLAVVSIVYWVLLLYMVAALGWWFIALDKQNGMISEIRLNELDRAVPTYAEQAAKIKFAKERKTAQYIGEGVTFLALIILGAVFVFRATRRQLKLSQFQQNFMMAITHELKTPIAVTQLNLQTLQKRQLDETTKQKLIGNTLLEANRLNTLCNNILFASQLDTGSYVSSEQDVHFTDIVEGCIDDFKNRFPQREIKEDVEQDVHMKGEPLLLQLLVNNLIENAHKYSPKEASIFLAVRNKVGEIELNVKDGGQGISASDKKKIFYKFYRVGNENTRRTKGTGLGLFLCSKIVERHRGRISVSDNLPSGSIFTVIFPNT